MITGSYNFIPNFNFRILRNIIKILISGVVLPREVCTHLVRGSGGYSTIVYAMPMSPTHRLKLIMMVAGGHCVRTK